MSRKADSWQHLMAGVRVALAVCLALTLGAFPLLQGLHMWVADHGHRYCPEHGAVEDVPRLLRPHAGAPITANTAVGSAPHQGPRSHQACTVLSSPSARCVAAPGKGGCDVELAGGGNAPKICAKAAVGTASRRLILIAPKQSPPLVGCWHCCHALTALPPALGGATSQPSSGSSAPVG
jgi:hypothetical protein